MPLRPSRLPAVTRRAPGQQHRHEERPDLHPAESELERPQRNQVAGRAQQEVLPCDLGVGGACGEQERGGAGQSGFFISSL